MRIRRIWAAAWVIAIVLAPLASSATTWEEWKFLMRRRPVAVLVAVPPLVATSPFMGATWLFRKVAGTEEASDDEDAESDEDEDEEE